jgi:hypothetical protein
LGLVEVSVVEDIVSPVLFLFLFVLCFFFVVVVPVVSFVLWVLWLVFCAKIAAQGSSESPRAAIMIFFILGISPY